MQSDAKKQVMEWAKATVAGYEGVNLTDNSWSGVWANGLAFVAILHRYFPDQVGAFESFDGSTEEGRKHNFEVAFSIAQQKGVPCYLDVDDMILCYPQPDSKSVFLYVATLYKVLKRLGESSPTTKAPKPTPTTRAPSVATVPAMPAAAAPAPAPAPALAPAPQLPKVGSFRPKMRSSSGRMEGVEDPLMPLPRHETMPALASVGAESEVAQPDGAVSAKRAMAAKTEANVSRSEEAAAMEAAAQAEEEAQAAAKARADAEAARVAAEKARQDEAAAAAYEEEKVRKEAEKAAAARAKAERNAAAAAARHAFKMEMIAKRWRLAASKAHEVTKAERVAAEVAAEMKAAEEEARIAAEQAAAQDALRRAALEQAAAAAAITEKEKEAKERKLKEVANIAIKEKLASEEASRKHEEAAQAARAAEEAAAASRQAEARRRQVEALRAAKLDAVAAAAQQARAAALTAREAAIAQEKERSKKAGALQKRRWRRDLVDALGSKAAAFVASVGNEPLILWLLILSLAFLIPAGLLLTHPSAATVLLLSDLGVLQSRMGGDDGPAMSLMERAWQPWNSLFVAVGVTTEALTDQGPQLSYGEGILLRQLGISLSGLGLLAFVLGDKFDVIGRPIVIRIVFT